MNKILKKVLIGAARFFQILPRRIALGIGAALGAAAFVCCAPRTLSAVRNLRISMGEDRGGFWVWKTIFKMYCNFGRNLIDFLRLPLSAQKDHREEFLESVRVEGAEHLQEAFRKGRGVLALTAHLGNWELMAARVVALGFPVNILVKRIRQPALNELLRELREGAGVHPIPKTDSIREIIARLKKNELVGFVLDQRVGRSEGVRVSFFGRPAMTISGLALLALRFDVPVIPMFTFRERDRSHRIVIGPPVSVPLGGNREEEVRTLTQAYSDIIEKFVREYPDQWIWIHKRWGK